MSERRATDCGAPGCIHPTAGLRGPERRAINLFVISLPGMASAAAVSCFFCYCYVLYCIVLYCIVGFSGFLYIRKALLISGENWMFGFGFSAFLFVCFFRRVFCFKTCLFDSSSSRLLGAFLCLPMLFISYFSMQINFIPYLCTLKQRESELNYRYWKYSSQGSAF